MCDDCVVRGNEAYLTDSPGVDGGAYDIDYGNTKNSVVDNYAHDTQGYCVAVFGAGFVTRQSTVRGNLCINNGRSPRMAKYQGAIFLLTWNDGSIDGVTIENNTVYWSPFESVAALLNEADIKPGNAVFRNNTIYSTSPSFVNSNPSLTFTQNHYVYFGAGDPRWEYGTQQFNTLADHEPGSTLVKHPLRQWTNVFEQEFSTTPAQAPQRTEQTHWLLTCILPVSLNAQQLLDDTALQQITTLKSFSQQYRPQGLRVSLRLTTADKQLFTTAAFRNAIKDLDLDGISIEQFAGDASEKTTLSASDGRTAEHWDGIVGPVQLGLALRRALGEPLYAQMGVKADE
jgi:hypothetical protein